ncbi:DNA-directed RNA polymerase subunit E'' [Candidatus Woesearchaeota archaeon]|nr:DNA-directed RNA polymerase subunit E'' [Candidatus Woesearchaeota archaeon]
MTKKKACKQCRIFVEGNECPICKGNQFVLNWKGRLCITNIEKSRIGKKIGLEREGEYVIKVR